MYKRQAKDTVGETINKVARSPVGKKVTSVIGTTAAKQVVKGAAVVGVAATAPAVEPVVVTAGAAYTAYEVYTVAQEEWVVDGYRRVVAWITSDSGS